MIRQLYQKPEIIVVPINPEQAVLSNCSVGAGNLSNQNTSGSCVPQNCRQKNGRGGSDSAASS